MVEEIKEEEKLEHQTNKQWYGLTILTILTTVYNSVTVTTKERRLAYTDIEISQHAVITLKYYEDAKQSSS